MYDIAVYETACRSQVFSLKVSDNNPSFAINGNKR